MDPTTGTARSSPAWSSAARSSAAWSSAGASIALEPSAVIVQQLHADSVLRQAPTVARAGSGGPIVDRRVDRWRAVGVEGRDRLQAPGLALGPLGLGPGDRLPVRGVDQPAGGVAQLDAVAAGLVDVEEEGLLDGVLVRAGLDEHAAVQADVGGPQDVLAGVGAERDVVQPPARARPVVGVDEVVGLLVEVRPLAGDDAGVQQDLLGDPGAERVADEVAVAGRVAGQVVDVVEVAHRDAAAGVGL